MINGPRRGYRRDGRGRSGRCNGTHRCDGRRRSGRRYGTHRPYGCNRTRGRNYSRGGGSRRGRNAHTRRSRRNAKPTVGVVACGGILGNLILSQLKAESAFALSASSFILTLLLIVLAFGNYNAYQSRHNSQGKHNYYYDSYN